MSVAPSSTFKGSAQLLMVNWMWAINLAGTQHDKTNCLLSATLGQIYLNVQIELMEKMVQRQFLCQQPSKESHKAQAFTVISISKGCIANYLLQFLLSSTVTTKHCTETKTSSSDTWATTQRSAFGCENKCLALAEEHGKGAAGGLSCTFNK